MKQATRQELQQLREIKARQDAKPVKDGAFTTKQMLQSDTATLCILAPD
ncbi:hypothetical protein [Hymenobacter cellulosivorans]|uniref:Uncharacterized protein n=1 Tax=Hymenobacter cellulosivorans TaxID=2932249 RepID=A0ABY4FAA8_9BACT|nr:hypothetical protein [Hymenobacter cellulosivorans]UOQ53116.1 hypothetical protein MUN80_25705 [Hymenobacter cellulosivorans]